MECWERRVYSGQFAMTSLACVRQGASASVDKASTTSPASVVSHFNLINSVHYAERAYATANRLRLEYDCTTA